MVPDGAPVYITALIYKYTDLWKCWDLQREKKNSRHFSKIVWPVGVCGCVHQCTIVHHLMVTVRKIISWECIFIKNFTSLYIWYLVVCGVCNLVKSLSLVIAFANGILYCGIVCLLYCVLVHLFYSYYNIFILFIANVCIFYLWRVHCAHNTDHVSKYLFSILLLSSSFGVAFKMPTRLESTFFLTAFIPFQTIFSFIFILIVPSFRTLTRTKHKEWFNYF